MARSSITNSRAADTAATISRQAAVWAASASATATSVADSRRNGRAVAAITCAVPC